MWIILGFFISFQLYALEPFERLSRVKILKVLPNNILLLDRGIEDGIQKNDHIKLTQDADGYTARGICLRARGTTSYWKLYRIPEASKISKDLDYTIVGMADREIPLPHSELRETADFVDPEMNKAKPLGPDPFAIKRDLPEKLTERDMIDAVGPEERKLFIEKAINQDQLARDLKDYRISLFASPFTRQSINDGKSYRYGARGGNLASKYRLLFQLERQESRIRDPYTREQVETSNTQGQAQFVIHRISPGMSSLAVLNYNSLFFSEDIGSPKSHWQFGPLGFTWHLFENRTWEYFDLSYVPLYDVRVTEYFNTRGELTDVKETGLRHGFRLAMKNKLNELVAFENILWIRPYQELATWRLRSNDQNLVNDMKFIFTLSKNFFMDYNFVYQKDVLWDELSNLPSTNIINSLNLRYDFDI